MSRFILALEKENLGLPLAFSLSIDRFWTAFDESVSQRPSIGGEVQMFLRIRCSSAVRFGILQRSSALGNFEFPSWVNEVPVIMGCFDPLVAGIDFV